MPKYVRNSILILVFILFSLITLSSFLIPNSVRASLTACSVSVSPATINSGASDTLVFNVTNDDEAGNQLHWVKIARPSGDFTITSGDGPSNGGVELATDGSSVVIKTTMSGGEMGAFSVGVTAGSNSGSGSFNVQVSDVSEGDNPTTCSGDTTVTIPETAQTIQNSSNISVSVSDSAATISWSTITTNIGTIDYGTSTNYGSSVAESNVTTSHSINITGLSANTTYHFRITTGSTQFSDSTFKTAVSGTTTTTTTTVTNTVTTIVTPKVNVDTTPPVVSIKTNFEKPFESAPEISGKALDPSRIVKIEYSVDAGLNWLAVENASLGDKSVSFSFTPDLIDDGNYKIQVRAVDGLGNTGKSKINSLVIDRLPPLVGTNIWSVGPIPVLPDTNGIITMLAEVDHKITMSVVGGPISVDLMIGTEVYPMTKSVDSGLWGGTVNFNLPGYFIVKVKSVDGAGNTTIRNLNSIVVINSGKVTDSVKGGTVLGATVKVYQKDTLSKVWNLWDALSFGQKNPQVISDSGSYSYLLPAGTYYLTVTASGYKRVTSKIFNITSSTVLNTDIVMSKGWWFNPFNTTSISVSSTKPITNEQYNNPLIGKELPMFTLRSIDEHELNSANLKGKNRMFVFLNTWLPSTNEQISQIKNLPKNYQDRITIIMEQENISRTLIFAKKGGYDNLSIVVDPDGLLIDSYNINSLPTSYFVDRKGVIRNVLIGVTRDTEIMNILDSN